MRKYIIAIFLSLLLCFSVYGADQKISELTALGAKPASDDELVIYDSSTGATKKVDYTYFEDIKNVNLYGGLTAAVASIGTTEATVLITDTQTVTDSLSIPTTMQLFITRGGDMAISSGKVLTINGSILAGSYQIFSGSGTVTFSGTGIEYGAWKASGTDAIRGKVTDLGRYAADAEASDTYVITLSPAPTAYYTGMVVNFYANTANTGAATLNVNSLGAKAIKKLHDQDLATGDIEVQQLVSVIYSAPSTVWQMQSQIAASAIATYVVFPATAVPSGDPNTLDDYEEGTWTIAIEFGGASASQTTSLNTGKYRKIGGSAIITGLIVLTNKGISTGNARLVTLPFTSGDYAGINIRYETVTFANQFMGNCNSGQTYVDLDEITEGGTRSTLTEGNFADNSTIMINFSMTI